MRPTMRVFPQSYYMQNKSHIPASIIMTPFAEPVFLVSPSSPERGRGAAAGSGRSEGSGAMHALLGLYEPLLPFHPGRAFLPLQPLRRRERNALLVLRHDGFRGEPIRPCGATGAFPRGNRHFGGKGVLRRGGAIPHFCVRGGRDAEVAGIGGIFGDSFIDRGMCGELAGRWARTNWNLCGGHECAHADRFRGNMAGVSSRKVTCVKWS